MVIILDCHQKHTRDHLASVKTTDFMLNLVLSNSDYYFHDFQGRNVVLNANTLVQ